MPVPDKAPVLRDASNDFVPAEEPSLVHIPKTIPKSVEVIPKLENMIPKSEPDFKVLGELFNTYFLLARGGELLLVDKHAAHERIIYERLKAWQGDCARQVLLEPLPLQLSREEAAALLEHRDLLERAGFAVEEFGTDSVLLRECPLLLTGQDLQGQMAEMAGYLLQKRSDVTTEALDWIYHSAACRAAVKAGDPTTSYERERFVEKLLAMPDIRHCPHGRPVIVSISKKEIEKRFGR